MGGPEKGMAMSNSKLVSYTKLSPNCNRPRNHVIDTITPHCYVGQASVESAGAWFANPNSGCSCNYFIGYDGRIALIVDESNRSWCTSSKENDHRAITIEIASDRTDPYAITDAAYNALIALCADICSRNNIKQLLWRGDKSLIGKVDQQNITVHRWFANKACPGSYIYNKLSQIAQQVNAKLKEDDDDMLSQEQFNKMMEVYLSQQRDKPTSDWALQSWNKGEVAGVVDGTAPQGLLTREQAIVMLDRLKLL